MESIQLRLLDDLRDIVTGEVMVDDLSRAAYSTDASVLQVRPQAIVAPKTIEELAGVVRYAAETGISLHPRGAGTGLAGESLGPELVVDTCRHLNRILETGPTSVRVQPGVRLSQLQNHLRPLQRMFAPDPLSGKQCTIGGMLGTDAAGPHALRYGTTRHHVHRIRAVLSDGEIVEFGQEPVNDPTADPDDRVRKIVTDVSSVLQEYKDDIAREQPSHLQKPGGYCLRGVHKGTSIDLPRLLVGSEGTLAFFAEAELATLPIPAHHGALLACFTNLEAAVQAVLECLEFQPTACEMLDRRTLSIVREANPKYQHWVPEYAEGLVLIEQEGSHPGNVRERLNATADRLRRHGHLAGPPVLLLRPKDLQACWNIRSGAIMELTRTADNAQPVPFIENCAVPVEAFPRFLRRVQDIMKRYGLTASYTAHIGSGTLHTRPLLDLRKQKDRDKLEPIANEVLDAALECKGTCIAEHGVGLLRSGLMDRQFPRLSQAFRRIKAIFDPHNNLNPGRIIGAELGLPVHRLRLNRKVATEPKSTQLQWPQLTVLDVADRCNGCADCQQLTVSRRMCPTYKVLQSELSSPRSKANLMRQVLSGDLDLKTLSGTELREVSSLCVNCKMCKQECPTGVDVSKLMLEAKAAFVVENGLERTDRFFARLDAWSRSASSMAVVANGLLSNGLFRLVAEKLFGLSRHRQLPRFHHQTFLRRAARNGWSKKPRVGEPRPKIALLVDTYANCNDPHLSECLVRVLEHNGFRVYVPPAQEESGIAPLHYGDIDAARANLDWTLKTFGDLVRDGYDVVSPEPSAILMIRHEAPDLIDHPDLPLLIEKSFEASEYLTHLLHRNRLKLDFSPVPMTCAYHEPCHLRALDTQVSVADLLKQIPKLRLVELDHGCSGMAGTYGLRADGFEVSLAAGQPMLHRVSRDDIHLGAAQCSACRMQIEQGSQKRALHPVHLLAVAYGLVQRPEVLFQEPAKGLLSR